MRDFHEDIERHLPLVISSASWDELNFHISGNGWSFRTQSPWRIFHDSTIVSSSDNKDLNFDFDTLKGKSLLSAVWQSRLQRYDPAFELSDGSFIEIFSLDEFEPWVFYLPDACYVGGYKDCGCGQE